MMARRRRGSPRRRRRFRRPCERKELRTEAPWKHEKVRTFPPACEALPKIKTEHSARLGRGRGAQTDRQTEDGPPRREGRTERLTRHASSSCIPIVPSARPLARPLSTFSHPTHSSLNARQKSTMSITPTSTPTCFRMPCHRPPVIQPSRKFPAPRGNKRRFRRSLRTPGEFGKKKVLRLHGTLRS